MIALRLVRLIEAHADQVAIDVVKRVRESPHTGGLQKISDLELHARIQDR
jgi:hypothetical protein